MAFLCYNGYMLIPRIRPDQIKQQPDQVAAILNRVIDAVNALQSKKII